MVNIFLSYVTCDKDYIEELKKYLESDTRIRNAFIVPREQSYSIHNSEKITKYIDISQIFISLMSEKALTEKESNWLHQELGYAFNHMKNGFMKIILLSDNREVVKGFIDRYNYDLSIEMEDPKSASKKIISVIFSDDNINSNLFPVKIRYKPDYFKKPQSGNHKISTVIDNESYTELDHLTITIVTPDGTSLDIMGKNPMVERFLTNGNKIISLTSNIIPVNLLDNIENKGNNTTLTTIYLKRLHSYNTYNIEWELQVDSLINDKNLPYKFGIILKLPIHGVSLYQGEIKEVSNDELMIKIEPLENGKIVVE